MKEYHIVHIKASIVWTFLQFNYKFRLADNNGFYSMWHYLNVNICFHKLQNEIKLNVILAWI